MNCRQRVDDGGVAPLACPRSLFRDMGFKTDKDVTIAIRGSDIVVEKLVPTPDRPPSDLKKMRAPYGFYWRFLRRQVAIASPAPLLFPVARRGAVAGLNSFRGDCYDSRPKRSSMGEGPMNTWMLPRRLATAAFSLAALAIGPAPAKDWC